jgi:hypothetical protein
MDGDGSDIIADLPRLIAPIQNNEADFVLGSRIRGHREPGSMLPSQLFAAHRILEIPVDYRRRIGGTSKVSGNLKASLKAAGRILNVLLRTTFFSSQ